MAENKHYDKCCSTCARMIKDNCACYCKKKVRSSKRIINYPNMSVCSWYRRADNGRKNKNR